MLPSRLRQLISLLSGLPGVGEKTAQRYALFLATQDGDLCASLGEAMLLTATGIGTCSRCGNIADRPEDDAEKVLCTICSDTRRDAGLLCVVHRVQDLLSIERSMAVQGYYFVLGRLLSPLEGIGAEQLPIEELKQRITSSETPVREVVVATPPSVDGEATALLLSQQLKPLGVSISRIASGVPHGGDLEYADPVTIGRAIAGRRGLE